MYLVVGLGNPGPKYADTRHNLGFRVIEELSKRYSIGFSFKNKANALIGIHELDDHKIILAQPQTFMNNSGEAVAELLRWYKIPPDHLIVAYDDVDLEVGELRIRMGGTSAGHKGVESIMHFIGTPEFIRVRVGIGRESLTDDITDYVLAPVPPSQQTILEEIIFHAADAVISIITEGLEKAMNKFNALRA
jgi:PTH1 family peptidyl-tRNA hydrolase